jgi:hypothetical protein
MTTFVFPSAASRVPAEMESGNSVPPHYRSYPDQKVPMTDYLGTHVPKALPREREEPIFENGGRVKSRRRQSIRSAVRLLSMIKERREEII